VKDLRLILVATNDAGVRESLLSILNHKNYFVTVLNRGSEVLLTVLENDIDLAIIDLELQGMSGREIIPIIRRTRPKVPIIAVSGDNSFETGKEIAQQGVWYYLPKPLNLTELDQLLSLVECKTVEL